MRIDTDFRPEYKQLGKIRGEIFPGVPVIALTATATQTVRDDVTKTLKMRNPAIFTVSFFRQNLTFRVIPKDYTVDKETKQTGWVTSLLSYISERKDETGIVYCLSRDDAENTAAMINSAIDVPAAHYHAGMTSKQRTIVQNAWRRGEIRVVAATIAFGMGIDHATVRYVVHASMSKSLEGYYQEAGRAGRDGLPAECVLYYGKRDGPRLINLMRRGKRGRSKSLQGELQQFHAISEYCLNGQQCRHAQLIGYLGERWSQGRCGDKCDVCRDEVVVHASASGGAKSAKQQARKTANEDARKRKLDEEIAMEAQPLPGFKSAARVMEQNMHTSSKPTSKASGNKSILSCFKNKTKEWS